MSTRANDRFFEEDRERDRRYGLEYDEKAEVVRELELADRIADQASLPRGHRAARRLARARLGLGRSPYKQPHAPAPAAATPSRTAARRATSSTDDGELAERPTPPGITHDQAERHERLHQGAEALRQLKPQEARALRLTAEGYTYKEICQIAAWTYTKVNRCLTERRRALRPRTAAIDTGEECERLAPLLSDAIGRMVGTGDVRRLERHLRNCLYCRARLASLRAEQGGSQTEPSPKALGEAA